MNRRPSTLIEALRRRRGRALLHYGMAHLWRKDLWAKKPRVLVPEVLLATPIGHCSCGAHAVKLYPPLAGGRQTLHADEARKMGYYIFKRREDHEPISAVGVDWAAGHDRAVFVVIDEYSASDTIQELLAGYRTQHQEIVELLGETRVFTTK